MDIVNLLRREESKLVKESDRITHQLGSIRTAINALGGKRGPRAGRKLSAAHRAAIKRGIAAKKTPGARAGRKVSAASRAKMAKAQRERWAKVKKSEANKK